MSISLEDEIDQFYQQQNEEDFEKRFEDEFEVMKEVEANQDENEPKSKRKLSYDQPLVDESSSNQQSSFSLPESKKSKNSTTTDNVEATDTHHCHSPLASEIDQNIPNVVSIPLIGSEWLPVTGSDGRRVYVRFKKSDTDNFGSPLLASRNHSKGQLISPSGQLQLLSTPFSILRDQVEEMRLKKLLNTTNTEAEPSKMEIEEGDANDTDGNVSHQDEKQKSKAMVSLWVDKYSPHHYRELLSDHSTNRSLLSWLKLWDKTVFGKDFNIPDETLANQLAVDTQNRPLKKVALLCGPPGLGKTTLAHVIARHAGYNVLEMNASDDRSVEIFRQRIESATQMHSISGDEKGLPNCLLIDEIDGAPTASVEVLIKFIRNTENAKVKKKSKGHQNILSRPIICICNDQYVPSLRQLRQHALVITFPPTSTNRLAGRLQDICRKEKLLTDLFALSALCSKAENDIRSCINTLQFLQRQSNRFSTDMVHTIRIGQKDQKGSLFDLWKNIFRQKKDRSFSAPVFNDQIEKEADHLSYYPNHTPRMSSTAKRFYNILNLTMKAGEYDKLMQGLFENYLNIKFKDRYLTLFSQKIRRINYLVLNVMGEVSPTIRRNLFVSEVVMYLLPSLLEILSPAGLANNAQLHSQADKEQLLRVVNAMISYNLSYQQIRNSDGQYNYLFEPPIDEVIHYPGQTQQKQLSYNIKQIIAQQVEHGKLKWHANEINELDKQQPLSKELKRDIVNTKRMPPKESKIAEILSGGGDQPFARNQDSFLDAVSESDNKNLPEELKASFWYRFNEGFTNAVRRNIKMKHLL
ncbi:uncharacterized protein TRIADDRAFT_53969 [Trichoplax adhaerens]|uniref:AAA+ ATPase domain-containing protein n=1 Tax=Trichoplax adhaerens TaxID=10228 RepID=B3RMJ4_TRIAD|nr:hypothetical protein TRIADDRAFT_53969 [Trichoplax adhaerens]EDV27858.1 hypothetical protein TRIADDRAFT_53969 [Trichoplax adhaerens]|eukprot:XP_002109692.1 hypothetical protein TRIADDRAFT_53969 [Trichoplax adhaerens]